MPNEKEKTAPRRSEAVVVSGSAPTAPKAPAGIFSKHQTVEESLNPVRVKIIKGLIDNYTEKGGDNVTKEVAKVAYKDLVSACEQIQTLTGVDLRECLSYLVQTVGENRTGAYGRASIFRFLPEVAKQSVMDRTTRLLNMVIFFANYPREYFHQMVSVSFSVAKVTNQEVRDQIAAYFQS